jgi:hypothetical protein
MADLLAIKKVAVREFRKVPDLKRVVDHQPELLPKTLPALTMLILAPRPRIIETGGGVEVTYQWRLNLYTNRPTYEKGQVQLEVLLPQLVQVLAANPMLDGLCNGATIVEDATEPIFSPDTKMKYVRLPMRLEVTVSEIPGL